MGAALLSGCGRVTAPDSIDVNVAGVAGAVATGGMPVAMAGTVGGGGGSHANDGVAGAEAETPAPAADFSGRWALFVFEDPVGVQLSQSEGRLSGTGCAAGTPPNRDNIDMACGDISGEVHGQKATFWFTFSFGLTATYLAETTISAGGERMTGAFHGIGDVPYPTAWLRVPDQEPGLSIERSGATQALNGLYDLSLEAAYDGGTEYTSGQSYQLRYLDREGIASDLGSFWHTEIRQLALDHSLEIGPLPLTSPELAQALRLETDADGIVAVGAMTGSGHYYRFKASRREP